jgi:hypothetical protein
MKKMIILFDGAHLSEAALAFVNNLNTREPMRLPDYGCRIREMPLLLRVAATSKIFRKHFVDDIIKDHTLPFLLHILYNTSKSFV